MKARERWKYVLLNITFDIHIYKQFQNGYFSKLSLGVLRSPEGSWGIQKLNFTKFIFSANKRWNLLLQKFYSCNQNDLFHSRRIKISNPYFTKFSRKLNSGNVFISDNSFYFTVWNFKDISATQILREIKYWFQKF